MEWLKRRMGKIPKIEKNTIKEHKKEIAEARKEKEFKEKSNRIYETLLKENPELVEVFLPTLESNKSMGYKEGYLAGVTTLYSLLKKQMGKNKDD